MVWVNWYFFFARRSVARATGSGGVQRVAITVQGGYDPAEVHVRLGVPVELVFDRQETSPCSEELVIAHLNIRKFLPAFEKTPIAFTPNEAGNFDITCGMSMLHGKLVVEG